MSDELISRQAAIAYAISGRTREYEGEKWIRVSEVRESLQTMPPAEQELFEKINEAHNEGYDVGYWAGRRDYEPQWIPVKTRPMTEEERQYWAENTAIDLEDEDAVFFDCQMPDDGQEVWVCYKSGTVSEDVCERDNDFCGLEGNGDWLDIVAWMPRIKPEPYKEKSDGGLN